MSTTQVIGKQIERYFNFLKDGEYTQIEREKALYLLQFSHSHVKLTHYTHLYKISPYIFLLYDSVTDTYYLINDKQANIWYFAISLLKELTSEVKRKLKEELGIEIEGNLDFSGTDHYLLGVIYDISGVVREFVIPIYYMDKEYLAVVEQFSSGNVRVRLYSYYLTLQIVRSFLEFNYTYKEL